MDDMTKAIIESAENMMFINDSIMESDSNIFGKIKDKIHKYFVLFVNLVRKAIEKIKGYYMTIKRKLTMAVGKILQRVAQFIAFRKSSELKKDNDNSIKAFMKKIFSISSLGKILVINDKNFNKLISDSNDIAADLLNDDEIIDAKVIKETFLKNNQLQDLIKEKSSDGLGLFSFATSLATSLAKSVTGYIDKYFNTTLSSYSDIITILKQKEMDVKKDNNIDAKELNTQLKDISTKVHLINYIRYTSAQMIAVACIKVCKRMIKVLWKFKIPQNE